MSHPDKIAALSPEQKDALVRAYLNIVPGAAANAPSASTVAATSTSADPAAPSIVATPRFSLPAINTMTQSRPATQPNDGNAALGWRTAVHQSAPSSNSSTNTFSAAAASFSNLAKSTTRGRPQKDAVSVKVRKNQISLIPAPAWDLSMSSKNKSGDLDAFLHDENCHIKTSEIKKDFTAAEVMEYIISTFAEKGWDLKVRGFQYAKTVGTKHQLKHVDFSPSVVDGAKLEKEYGDERCFIVMNTDEWPMQFRAYFQPSDVPPVKEQKRATLDECEWCLIVLPKSMMEDHTVMCPRMQKGFDMVPRKLGGPGTLCGGMTLDMGHPFFKGNLVGLHLPDVVDPMLNPEDERNAQELPDWKNYKAWCVCKGVGQPCVGQSSDDAWLECASKKDCPVRWFHYDCMKDAAGGEENLNKDWACFVCLAIERYASAGKRRRH
ncbi:hypothetical protein CF326_g6923 [Tilletia indica]|nr:hypothetical protein CF326_g6923 [Tilletia indica]